MALSTVGDVIDRLYREFLTPASRTPSFATLDGSITDSDTSFDLAVDMLAADEQSGIAPGVVLEIDLEQVLVTAYNPTSQQVTVRRGYNGTDAATHADDTVVVIAPEFSRLSAFDAVSDEIVGLHPALWGEQALEKTSSDEPVEVPADVVGIAEVTHVTSSGRVEHGQVEFLRNYPPVNSGRAIQFTGVPDGETSYILAKSEISRPEAEDDTLADLYLKDQWVPILVYGAASRMSSYVDPSKLNIDLAVDMDQAERIPVGSGTILERRLRSIRNELLDDASKRQDMEFPATIRYNDPFRPQSVV